MSTKAKTSNEISHTVEMFGKYKDLLLELTRKSIKLKYRNSWLGIFWSFLQPLLNMIVLSVVFGYTSIMKIINNDTTSYNIWTFVILGSAILVKIWLSFFVRKIAKLINSVSLKATAQDSLNDVISTTVVLIASIIEFSTGGKVHIDGWAGIFVSVFIAITGIKSVIETANPLIGVTPDNEIVQEIVKDILSYKGVLGVHDVICHSYGPTTLFMTLHVEVDYRTDILESHDLIDNIEREISFKHHVMLTIHMDPLVTDSQELNKLKDIVNKIINDIDSDISFHDFRMVEGKSHTNLIFDVVIPPNKRKETRTILTQIQKGIKEVNKDYFAVINIDSKYI